MKNKSCSDFHSVFTRFPVGNMSKTQWGRDGNINAILEISVAHGQPPLLYTENLYEPQQQHSSSLCWLALSRIANTLQSVASKLSNKHDIL